MRLYRLTPAGHEGYDEEPPDEWFASRSAAMRRYLTEKDAMEADRGYIGVLRLDLCELADLPPKLLLLAALNGEGLITSAEMVAAFDPARR